jgi:hypothetical protein
LGDALAFLECQSRNIPFRVIKSTVGTAALPPKKNLMEREVVFLKILLCKIFKKTTSRSKKSSSAAVGGANRN